VSDDEGVSALEELPKRSLDKQFGVGIDAGGGFVQNQDAGSTRRARAKKMSWR